jgi:hypothetical protein
MPLVHCGVLARTPVFPVTTIGGTAQYGAPFAIVPVEQAEHIEPQSEVSYRND